MRSASSEGADATLGDEDTLAKIARARTSERTAPCVDALEHREFASLLAARAARPEAPWLTYFDGDARSDLDTGAFLGRVASRVRQLESHGVRRGDRVGTLMHNDPEVPITCFAAWRLGATVVPINLGEDDDRIAFVLENAGVHTVVHLPAYRERAQSLAGRVSGPAWLSTADDAAPLAWNEIARVPSPAPDDEALIVYTSGTTGAPKGVVLTQQNLLVDARALADWNGLGAHSRLMCVLPVHHVNGLVVTLLTPFLAGGSVVLNRAFHTKGFWQRIASERVEIVSVVPTLLAFLLEDERGHAGLDLSAFRHLICGAGPLTVELAERFEERFGVRILHGYGLSETTCYSCMLPTQLPAAEHRGWMRDHGFPSIGTPLAPNEMDVHREDGTPVADGERGEIVIRGVNVMKGYYARPEANAETFAHGWFRSGDEGFKRTAPDGRPYFFITGRIKELIIRGGVNLSPFEIDEVLNGIPGIACGLAVGFENRWYGEEVGAYVVLHDGAALDESAVLAACREHLPFGKAPKVVVFGQDIPVTSTGKYQRGRLRPLFDHFRDTQFRAG